MPYSPSELYHEVLVVIAERSSAGLLTSRGWLVTSVLHKHPIKRHRRGDPDDFSICRRQLAVAAAVDRALARLKHQEEGGDPDAAELDLPRLAGYKHLRRIYPIVRDQVIFLVPLDKMTEEEIERKIETYEVASKGFAAHAAELRRYLAARSRAA